MTGVFQAFVPLRASSLGANGTIIGLSLVLAGGGIGLVTDLGFATYADARGRDRVVFYGFLCALVATSLLLTKASIGVLFVACFLLGLSNSAVGSSMLAMLTTSRHHHTQARTQGFNISVQRFGALLAALMVGVTLASRNDDVLVLTAVGACLTALFVMYRPTLESLEHHRSSPANDGQLEARLLLKDGYRQGLSMLRRREIMLATIVGIASNLIFIETNSFVPLIEHQHSLREALVITGALAARDVVAIGVGLWTIATGKDASSSMLIVSVLLLAAISAVGVGLNADRTHLTLIAWCGLQGVEIGVGIAATNLLTVVGSSESDRSLGMAATNVVNRVGVIIVPIILGVTLQLLGLKFVFFAVAGGLAIFGRSDLRHGL